MSWLASLTELFTNPKTLESVAYVAIYGLPLATQLSLLHNFIKISMYTANQAVTLVKRFQKEPHLELIVLELPTHKLSTIYEEDDEDFCIV